MNDEAGKLIQQFQGRGTVARRLRELMPALDEAIKAGISHEEILGHLKAHGLDVPLTTFRSNLFRYRKGVRSFPKKKSAG